MSQQRRCNVTTFVTTLLRFRVFAGIAPRKGVYSKRREFPYREDPFLEGDQTILESYLPWPLVCFPYGV